MKCLSQLPFVVVSGFPLRLVPVLLVVILGVASLSVVASEKGDPDTPEAGSVEAIAAATTRSDFRMVWNAILDWNDFPPPPSKTGDVS